MTVQQAAHDLLRQEGEPLTSRELAERMLAEKLVLSNARDPVFSLASTLFKNIKYDQYNEPKLTFAFKDGRRFIWFHGEEPPAGWEDRTDTSTRRQPASRPSGADVERLEVVIPAAVLAKVDRAVVIGFGESREDVIQRLIERGLDSASSELNARLRQWAATARF